MALLASTFHNEQHDMTDDFSCLAKGKLRHTEDTPLNVKDIRTRRKVYSYVSGSVRQH